MKIVMKMSFSPRVKKIKEFDKVCCIDPGIKNMGIFITDKNRTPHFYDVVNVGETPEKQLQYFKDRKDTFDVDVLLIERQISKNTKAVRLSMVIISFFLLNYPNCNVIEISSKFKLGGEKSFDGTKKICIRRADRILEKNESYKDLKNFIETQRKKDDISDVLCYSEEFLLFNGV